MPEIVEAHLDEMSKMDPVLDRYRLYEGIRKSLEIGERPKAIIIDNFQWVDKESLEVLRYLIRSLKDFRILFVLVNRIEDTTPIVADFLNELDREVNIDEINLRPFPFPEVQQCVQAIIGDVPDDKLVQYAYQTIGGNPYFLEELFRALDSERYLTLESERWEFQIPKKALIPKSIEFIALNKYKKLSVESQKVLQFASIMGNFDIRALRFLTGYGESEVQGLLAYIKRAGVLRESQGKLIFVDEFSRQAIYKKHLKGELAKKKTSASSSVSGRGIY